MLFNRIVHGLNAIRFRVSGIFMMPDGIPSNSGCKTAPKKSKFADTPYSTEYQKMFHTRQQIGRAHV